MERISYDADFITKEISESINGVGSDISLSLIYDQIREARNEDDPRLSMGIWERELKKADWPLVESVTADILSTKSKDLQILAWYIEAVINIEKLNGIPKSLQTLKTFLESFWYTCFPQDIEKKQHILFWIEEKINNFIITFPFVEDISLYDYEYALNMKALSKRSAEAEIEITQSAMKENRKNIDDIQNIIRRNDTEPLNTVIKSIYESILSLIETTDKILKGEFVLSFSKILENLEKIKKIIDQKLKNKNIVADDNKIDRKENEDKRNAIYSEIKKLSENLKKIERHSPTPFFLDLVVSWKDKNKSLFEVMNDLKEGQTEAHKLLKILIHN